MSIYLTKGRKKKKLEFFSSERNENKETGLPFPQKSKMGYFTFKVLSCCSCCRRAVESRRDLRILILWWVGGAISLNVLIKVCFLCYLRKRAHKQEEFLDITEL
jgi:hypothetical protein